MSIEKLNALLEKIKGLSPVGSIQKLVEWYPGNVVFSTSFGLEDQVITDIICRNSLPIEIFTLDTGRLFQETYDLMEKTILRYGIRIKVYYPDTIAVEKLITEKGPNSFYHSVENRKECCRIRKVEPLKRALLHKSVWITGLRAEQSEHRASLQMLEWDEAHSLLKYHPLLNWRFNEVQQYIKENQVPYNILHDKGYPSIGCLPCTRAIQPGEDFRAGRWWWENSHKECGLHE